MQDKNKGQEKRESNVEIQCVQLDDPTQGID